MLTRYPTRRTLFIFIALAALVCFAPSAFAVTIYPTPHASETSLDDILAADGYSHAGSIAELNAYQSLAEIFTPRVASSNVTLLIEDAGYRNENELGIYSASDPTRMATLFNGIDSAPSTATIVFGAGGLESINGTAVAAGFGADFGFYLKNAHENFVWYSQVGLNVDGYDHFVAFEEDGVLWGAFEDLAGGGDMDFNDLAFRMQGVASAPVPEPSAALIFSAGLLVASQAIRRRPEEA